MAYQIELSDFPEVWAMHNWQRPYLFLEHLAGVESMPSMPYHYQTAKLTSGFALDRALRRTSLLKAAGGKTTTTTLNALLECIYACLGVHTELFAAIHTMNVDGWKDGWWMIESAPRRLRSTFSPIENLAPLVQGQAWANGDGIAVILGLDWEYLQGQVDDAEYGYARALMACGRVGQSMLHTMQGQGYSSRMTPAVAEATASEVLALKPEQDALYFIRFARESEDPRA